MNSSNVPTPAAAPADPVIYSLVPLMPPAQKRRAELRARHDRNRAAWERIATHGRGGSSATKEQQARIEAEGGAFSNEERAELETLDFRAEPPRAVFVYPSDDLKRLTGFMGNTLLSVTYLHPEFRGNFGDTRRNFRAVGINGIRYSGTIYGTYARAYICRAALKSAS
jgi:hypothetical protein